MAKLDKHEILHKLHYCATLLHQKWQHGSVSPSASQHGQRRVLYLLHECDGMSQKELLERLGVRSASLSELVKRMEDGGLVTRRQGTVDKRITNIFLTDAGRSAAHEALAARKGVVDALFVNLDEGECRTLSELLDKLALGLLPESKGGDAIPPHNHPSLGALRRRHGHHSHHRE